MCPHPFLGLLCAIPMHACANALTHFHAHPYTEERAKKRERILKGFEVFDEEQEGKVVRREVRQESPGESRQEREGGFSLP